MTMHMAWLFLFASFRIASAANIVKVSDNTLCTAEINGQNTTIPVGEIWDSTDPCITFICEVSETGKVQANPIEEECQKSCQRGFELQSIPNKCCSICVKTKCLYLDKIYSIGDTWHNTDRCMLFECVRENNSPVISTFKKSCPDLSNCPAENIYTKDCCQYCRDGKSLKVDTPNRRDLLSSYDQHPCKRKCTTDGPPMTCEYKFQVEWYETLSKACYDCPLNISHCGRPQCITGDGVRKSVLVVNRRMPGPAIEVCLNDTLIVDVANELIGDSTTIHWHGLHQKETPYMDGVPNLTQCPIIPYTTFRYTFQADSPGTHFWHSHVGLQRGDGCFGALIVRRSDDPHLKLYDFDLTEHIVTMQDWIHTNGITMFTHHHLSIGDNKPVNILINGKGRYLNPSVVITDPIDEGTTDSIETTTYSENDIQLQNDTSMKMIEFPNEIEQNITNRINNVPFETFNVVKGSRYRFRTINSGFLNCPIIISVDNHSLLVIQSDGFDLEPIEVKSLVSYAGERFDFVVTADQDIGNYWIRFKGVMDCDERFENVHQVAILRYHGAPNAEPTEATDYDYHVEGLQLNPLNKGPGQVDSLTIAEVSALGEEEEWVRQKDPDLKFYVYYDFYASDHSLLYNPPLYGFSNVSKKVYSPQLNHISLKIPPLPLLPARDQVDESTFCNETSLKGQGIDCEKEFCQCHHVLKVPLNSVVEMVIVDEGHTYDANHPFHLHGHSFRVIGMDRVGKEVTINQIKDMDNRGLLNRNLRRPPIKDTITVPDGGYSIIRFKANNPGYWLFHCHIEFHAEIGMALIFKVGENKQMLPVPVNFPTCSNYMPSVKNVSSTKINPFRVLYQLLMSVLGLKYK